MHALLQHALTKDVLATLQAPLELLQVVLPAHGLERVAVVDPG